MVNSQHSLVHRAHCGDSRVDGAPAGYNFTTTPKPKLTAQTLAPSKARTDRGGSRTKGA